MHDPPNPANRLELALPHFRDQSDADLRRWLAERNAPGFRLEQLLRWAYTRAVDDFDSMTDLPNDLRVELAKSFRLWASKLAAHHRADDGSEKLLLELHDGATIECALLRDDRGHCTACISSQVGCGMGCAFCASGLDGVARNLTAGEIVEQLLHLNRAAGAAFPPQRLTHIVVMGMGEPLANLEAVWNALDRGRVALGISARRITISTVGLPKGIRELARRGSQYHLAVSLHAADDELRSQIVPANRRIGLAEVVAAADEYFEITGRRVMYEYVLLAGVNDQPVHARQLAALLKGRPALVNLIPLNPVPELPYETPEPSAVERFAAILRRAGLNIEVRRRKGDQIEAACGQLRRRSRLGQTGSNEAGRNASVGG